jgi:hypothetical protein
LDKLFQFLHCFSGLDGFACDFNPVLDVSGFARKADGRAGIEQHDIRAGAWFAA